MCSDKPCPSTPPSIPRGEGGGGVNYPMQSMCTLRVLIHGMSDVFCVFRVFVYLDLKEIFVNIIIEDSLINFSLHYIRFTLFPRSGVFFTFLLRTFCLFGCFLQFSFSCLLYLLLLLTFCWIWDFTVPPVWLGEGSFPFRVTNSSTFISAVV